MSTSFRMDWRGPQVEGDVLEGVDVAMGRTAARAASVAKAAAHVITGTLQRSIHAARAGYDGRLDQRVAETTNIPPEGFGFGLGEPNTKLEWVVGSWVDYAVYERGRGGGHDFLSAAYSEAQRALPGEIRRELKRRGY